MTMLPSPHWSAIPRIARLSDSVPPDVKNNSLDDAPRIEANRSRAVSRHANAFLPSECVDDGFPQYSVMASLTVLKTSDRTGVVALWSRYTIAINSES